MLYDYEVLKAQYEDLQSEYCKLFKGQYSKDKENCDLTGHIYSKNENSHNTIKNKLHKAKSSKDVS